MSQIVYLCGTLLFLTMNLIACDFVNDIKDDVEDIKKVNDNASLSLKLENLRKALEASKADKKKCEANISLKNKIDRCYFCKIDENYKKRFAHWYLEIFGDLGA